MNKKVEKLLNEQINKEFYSAYLYFDMASYYESLSLDGFASWFKIQAKEEEDHGHLIYTYLQNENIKVTLEAIAKPDKIFKNPVDPLKAALEHEKFVSESIHNILSEARKDNDFRTVEFLLWFVEEQAEEESSASTLLDRMNLFGKDGGGLYLLDRELSERKYSPPSLEI